LERSRKKQAGKFEARFDKAEASKEGGGSAKKKRKNK
jgi:hypothetical protein